VTDNKDQRLLQVRLEITIEFVLDIGDLYVSYKIFKELWAPRLVGFSSRKLHQARVLGPHRARV